MAERHAEFIELEAILESHIATHRDLLKLCKKETEIILSRKDGNLTMLVSEQEALLEEVRRLENKRITVVSAIAGRLGARAKDLSLKELLDVLPKDEGRRLSKHLVDLSRLIEELSIVNQTNSRMLTQADAYAKMLISAAIGSEAPARAYGEKGTKEKKAIQRSLIDRRA